jgi:hypothetical protein
MFLCALDDKEIQSPRILVLLNGDYYLNDQIRYGAYRTVFRKVKTDRRTVLRDRVLKSPYPGPNLHKIETV